MGISEFHEFENRSSLAETLADRIYDELARLSEAGKPGTVAFSGGSTPKKMLEAFGELERQKHRVSWDNAEIALIDERRVPTTHERSNFRMITAAISETAESQKNGDVSRDDANIGSAVIPLYHDGQTALVDCRIANELFGERATLPLTFAVLGMGLDGHTASWFPGAPELGAATNPGTREVYIPITASDGEERITMTLPFIAAARSIIVHIEGREKHAVLDTALQDGDRDALPIRHLLHHANTDVEVYWAP